MNRQLAPLLLLGTLFLHACGGGGSTPPPPPPPPAISVAFSTAPPGSLGVNATANIAVTVSNDSANAGATFTCAPAGFCGAFSAVTSTSATYTAPGVVPTGGMVTVTAAAVSDATKNAHANVTINGPTIAVAISQQPPAAMVAGGQASVTATVTNDPAGVDWSCTPTGTCGSFNPTNTASGVPTTYTAPSSVPAGGQVTLTATSHTDPTQKKSTNSITITGSAKLASLKGQYAFYVTSPTGDRGAAAWVGSVTLDGTGKVMGGVEDIVSPVRNDQQDAIVPTGAGSDSLYTVDASGHGRIMMQTALGEHLGISLIITSTNSSGVATHAEIIEADGSTGDAGNPGSGTFDLQTSGDFSSSKITGAYSVILSGVDNDVAKTNPPVSLGGVFNFGSSSITGTIDTNSNGVFSSATFAQGSIDIAPDAATGRGQFHIAPSLPEPARSFVFYIVNAKVLRVFESGAVSFTGGSMYSQGTAPPVIAGNFVYQHSGWSSAGRTVAAGLLSADQAGDINSGISDSSSGGKNPFTSNKSVAVTGSYQSGTSELTITTFTDAAGTSSFIAYPVSSGVNILDPNNSTGGGGALLLHTDNQIIGTGLLIPQKSPAVFSLSHALSLVNAIAAPSPKELDLVGILTSDGTSAFTSSLADYARDSSTPIPVLGAGLVGTFTADASHSGRSTGNLTVTSLDATYSFLTGSPTAGATPAMFSVAIYQATPSQAFVVETDTHAIAAGQMVQQNLP